MPLLQVWDNLNTLAKMTPVEGNLDGEYLTMLSKVGLPAAPCIGHDRLTWVNLLLRSGTALCAKPHPVWHLQGCAL